MRVRKSALFVPLSALRACVKPKCLYLCCSAASRTGRGSVWTIRSRAKLTSPNTGEVTPTSLLRSAFLLHRPQLSSIPKMSLSEKSNEELGRLLSEYGIKHGPIVESTRKLYESKLGKAMAQAPVKTSSDKTYYREEEEVTYVTYHNAAKHEHSANVVKRRVMTEQDEFEEPGPDTESVLRITNSTLNYASVQSTGRKSTSRLWKVTLALLLSAVLAAVGYYAYTYVM